MTSAQLSRCVAVYSRHFVASRINAPVVVVVFGPFRNNPENNGVDQIVTRPHRLGKLPPSPSSGGATVVDCSTLWPHASTHGRPHIGANGVSCPPGKMDNKLKSENMQKEQFSMFLVYFESTIRAGRCRERRYADHIFCIQIYFRMHHFVVKFC